MYKAFLSLISFFLFTNLSAQDKDVTTVDSTSVEFIEDYIEQAWNQKDSFALAIFNKAISLNDKVPIVYWRRGRIYHLQQKLELALADYNKTIELDSTFNCGYGFWDRALVKRDMGDNDGALKDFDIAVAQCPKQSNFICYRGIHKYWNGDIEGAEKDLSVAIELYDDYYLARRWRAPVRTELENFEGAMEDYTKAPFRKHDETNPNWAYDMYLRGVAKNKTGDTEGACSDWSIAVKNYAETQVLIDKYCKNGTDE